MTSLRFSETPAARPRILAARAVRSAGRRLLVLALVLPALGAGSLQAIEPVALKQRWIPGKVYHFTNSDHLEMELTLANQKVLQRSDTVTDYSCAVRAADNFGNLRVTVTYDHVSLISDSNQQKVNFDSAHPETGNTTPATAAMGRLAGKSFSVILNNRNEPVDVDDWPKLEQELGPSAATFTKDSAKQMVAQNVIKGMPAHPMRPNEGWPMLEAIQVPQTGTLQVKGTYTLRGIEMHDGALCAEITADAQMAFDFSNAVATAGSNMQALKMRMENGAAVETVWFDIGLGIMQIAMIQENYMLTMANPLDRTQTIRMPSKQWIKTTLNKVEDLR